MKKIIIVLIGIVLVVGVIITGDYGLSSENIDIYEKVVAIQNGDSNFGFEGFALTDYPVAFYDGENDYVITWENGNYNIEKREAVIDFIAATAYPVGEHYEVHAPTVEKMSSLVSVMSMGEAKYGTQEQIATIWHEAFHCYQLTNFFNNIELICPFGVEQSVIVEYVDTNADAVSLFEQQAELLEEAVKSDDIDKVRECIVKYKQLDSERKKLLSKDEIATENYYTIVEGTACYIEAGVYKVQLPDEFSGNYIDKISEYDGGSGKYYRIGMAQCMIMDKLNPEWKSGFDFSETIINLIYKELEI